MNNTSRELNNLIFYTEVFIGPYIWNLIVLNKLNIFIDSGLVLPSSSRVWTLFWCTWAMRSCQGCSPGPGDHSLTVTPRCWAWTCGAVHSGSSPAMYCIKRNYSLLSSSVQFIRNETNIWFNPFEVVFTWLVRSNPIIS